MDETALPELSLGVRVLAPLADCGHCPARMLCLAGLGDKRASRRIQLPRDSVLYEAGQPVADALYAVRYGSFKSSRSDAGGQAKVTGFSMCGDLLGLDDIGVRQHRGKAVALQDSEVCQLPMRELHGQMAQFHRLLSREVARSQRTALLLRNTPAQQRLAHLLLQLSGKFRRRGYSGQRFRLLMSRQDMADYLVLAPETISRLLARFCKLGLIALDGREVELLKDAELRTLAGMQNLKSTR